jgi:hypothetical protein
MLARRGFALGAATVALAGRADGKAPPAVRVGYCALTWGDDNVKQAIADIAQVGYRGTQLRVRALKQFPSPAELKAGLGPRRALTDDTIAGRIDKKLTP